MRRYGGEIRPQWTGTLDRQHRLSIRPDITWWVASDCLAVVDAKYKALELRGMPNADAYQMLAYCTALRLSQGFLVYARDSDEEQRRHEVCNTDCVIEVRTLDVEAGPQSLLSQVDRLAAEIAASNPAMVAA
jgi:5-methylcytosine-specific restriction enzyme subunit McrC